MVDASGLSQHRLPTRASGVEVPQSEWTVERYDIRVFRFVADVVDLELYRWFHQRGELMYQRLGRPRPNHYPDLDQT